MTRTLILGGVRSGKSRRALQLARPHAPDVLFIATALSQDDEMRERIARHRAERPRAWTTVEVGTGLGEAIAVAATRACVVVDCLPLWLANLVCSTTPATLEREVDALLDAVDDSRADLVLVANETGLGVVPDNALARRFNDVAGRLHQRLAERCERVELTVAGLAVVLKPAGALGVAR